MTTDAGAHTPLRAACLAVGQDTHKVRACNGCCCNGYSVSPPVQCCAGDCSASWQRSSCCRTGGSVPSNSSSSTAQRSRGPSTASPDNDCGKPASDDEDNPSFSSVSPRGGGGGLARVTISWSCQPVAYPQHRHHHHCRWKDWPRFLMLACHKDHQVKHVRHLWNTVVELLLFPGMVLLLQHELCYHEAEQSQGNCTATHLVKKFLAAASWHNQKVCTAFAAIAPGSALHDAAGGSDDPDAGRGLFTHLMPHRLLQRNL